MKIKNCIRKGNYYLLFESNEQANTIWKNLESFFGHQREIKEFKCHEIDHEAFLIRYFTTERRFIFLEKKSFDELYMKKILKIINEAICEDMTTKDWRELANAS